MARVGYFLPAAFLFDSTPFLLVAVKGRVERLVGAVALSLKPGEKLTAGSLCFRADEEKATLIPALVRRALEQAWAMGARQVAMRQTVEEDSDVDRALRQIGFAPISVNELYEAPASGPLWESFGQIHARLRAGKLLPKGIGLTTLQPGLIPGVREFLASHLPASLSALAVENAGYRPEHSLALLLQGEVKGVLLCRRSGRAAFIGLLAVAPDLRGATGWANFLLLHEGVYSGARGGLDVIRFELNPEVHADTLQVARRLRARLTGRRVLLQIERR